MTPLKRVNVSCACYAIVSGIFAMMHNPKYRGENFSWDKFPKMMEEMCKTQIFLHVAGKSKIEEIEIATLAGEFGLEIAGTLIKRMGE